jgi:prepilin-type N-terminal cleavage/methylation domain-containing protein
MIKIKQAFTLIELLVSISIIVILWIILLVSLKWYSSNARDGVRLSELSNIDLQFEMSLFQGFKLQIPDGAITLESNWVVVWYQWYLSEYILNNIWVHGWGKDPLDDSYFIYRINGKKSTFQIMWFMEDELDMSWIFYETYAADLSKRQPNTKWKTLWILLEQTTNRPLQLVKTWTIDMRLETTSVDMYLSNTSKRAWTVNELYWILETLALGQNFVEPKECPTWFIPVPWNRDLWQTSFCVAKYEMTYIDADSPNSIVWWIDWNTVAYSWSKIPLSIAWKYPIADITQQEAIDACKSIWIWYHLITTNEWVTIARNIELQPINWSGWIVGERFIPTGVSNVIDMWCNVDLTSYTWRRWATKTWDNNCQEQRNKLILSNWEEILDLSWNIWEHVNKANTIDWTNYDFLTNPDLSSINNAWIDWSSISSVNKLIYWPSIWFDSTNGIGQIYQANWTIFLYWSSAVQVDKSQWLFSLYLWAGIVAEGRHIGFRCAKSSN